ncbi:hypothetical protein [Psychrobacillus lasiicapitis]|uniref:Uncharacterized protein n=1 Tax=Psychrobacillus lasiicapitis TaxID=1636719 RepID=A0A544T1V3_9BACI|nr:hypothetical protein [Psychrobacillus lasiicapitis]TQR11423.1 hypothetical protein FG382_15880 [Psychrobacillus lasiicapitis]GGA40672.1 hypothetical protein GCM10011384_32900 [Psychrobacillus lasiicapitis]
METQFIPNQKLTGDVRKNKNKSFFEKAKEHKKEIVTGTAIVFSVMGAILVVKNRAVIKSAIKSSLVEEALTKSIETKTNVSPLVLEPIEKSIINKFPIDNKINVREHIRNLPKGWNPSINKVELASKYGYSLEGHQTWVNAYTKASA